MTSRQVSHWQKRGPRYEREFRRKPAFDLQEAALLDLLDDLQFESVLEVGAGFGRITRLIAERWPDATITALDLSAEQLASLDAAVPKVKTVNSTIEDFRPGNRRWDLVIAVELLMHIPPSGIEAVIAKLRRFARKDLVSLDWAVPYGDTRALGGSDFCHDYESLYGDAEVRDFGTAQRIYHLSRKVPA